MIELLGEYQFSALIGLLGGIALGVAGVSGRFCTLGALEDAFYGRQFDRLRMWALALAVSIAGVALLSDTGAIDRSLTVYHRIAWNPLASIVGGLMFGYGMALAGNCGYGALTRSGQGDLRSFYIVLATGISAYMAVGGPTARIRETLFPTVQGEGLTAIDVSVGGAIGVSPLAIALIIAALFLALGLSSRSMRRSFRMILSGVAIGLAVVSGFWATTYLATTGFEGIETVSHTYTAPLGEAVMYLMTSSGVPMSFGIGSVTGVIVGSAAAAVIEGKFRWEVGDSPREMRRQLFGAFLMGTGGIIALGCSIGQGITAFSTLAWSAPVALAAIVAGTGLGLYQLIEGFGRSD